LNTAINFCSAALKYTTKKIYDDLFTGLKGQNSRSQGHVTYSHQIRHNSVLGCPTNFIRGK